MSDDRQHIPSKKRCRQALSPEQNHDFQLAKSQRLKSPPFCPSTVHLTVSSMTTTLAGSTPIVDINAVHALLLQMDAKLNNVNTRLDGLSSQLSTLKVEINEVKVNLAEQERGLQHMDTEVVELKEDIIPNIKTELQNSIDKLDEARLATELYSKKSNLLFFNIPSSPAEDTEQVLRNTLAKSTLPQVKEIVFMNVHRLPSKQKVPGTYPPIIAKFVRMKDREAVLQTISKATIILGTKRVGVAPHLPAPMQAERKRLVPIRNKMKSEGKDAKIKVTGVKIQLMVNGISIKV